MCGLSGFSSCYRTFPDLWMRVAPAQLLSHFTIGSNFTCEMLRPSPLPLVTSLHAEPEGAAATQEEDGSGGNPSCAPFDGVALRAPKLAPQPTPAGHDTGVLDGNTTTALCVELAVGMRQAKAAWNFPSGSAGAVNLTVALEATTSSTNSSLFGGAAIALSDHYAPPWTSVLAPSVSLFVLPIHNITAQLGDSGVTLPRGRWFHLTLTWSLKRGEMKWDVAGLDGAAGTVPLLRGAGSSVYENDPAAEAAAAGSHEGAVSYWSMQSFGEGGVCVASIASSVAMDE
jgi:hypothetical protein